MLIRVFTSWLAIVALAATASPPPNDLCSGAEAIPSPGPFPFSSTVVDIREATSVGDPGVPSCASFAVTNSVWYVFTPSSTALYTLSANTDTATTVNDTVMAIYTSAGGCSGPFTPAFCNDDAGDLQSAISAQLTGGLTYYI